MSHDHLLFDFARISQLLDELQGYNASIKSSNSEDLRQLRSQLNQSFFGATATGWNQRMDGHNTAFEQFTAGLDNLENVIRRELASHGNMQTLDNRLGDSFS
ncbi:hypothetical protein JK358_35790 [Nocardia sp. 2]|uniref:WXG100 family type VII secretion target n=1 Tax=Nocardia acididurans TaxID=2802282 RepID=A0ABS1MKJ6_9NOCA|nr:hypothetical protein [Nocardia acididurans]MBL1079778.1 hypothetical protein [Nocardia acididurans]